jgi:hypothetical protein
MYAIPDDARSGEVLKVFVSQFVNAYDDVRCVLGI